MRQHRLALCKDHFPEWIQNQVEKFIVNQGMFTRNDRILLAVSGGKDSLALWDVLWQLGYSVEGLYIHLGIDSGTSYSAKSEGYVEKFAQQHDLKFYSVNFQDEFGETIAETAARTQRGRSRPCSVCGLVKRHLMNQYAYDHSFDVLVTAHNLDDQVAFLFSNILDWDIDTIRRQAPLLPPEQGFIRKAKPFFRISERETAAYVIVRAIDYIQIECPFSSGTKQIQYKNLLNQLEDQQPGVKLRFMTNYLKSFDHKQSSAAEPGPPLFCTRCGQPTTSEGLCNFCRLLRG